MNEEEEDDLNWRTELTARLHMICDLQDIPPVGKGRQRALAIITGATQEAARKWLKGYSMPSYRAIRKLAAAFNVSPGWLHHGQEATYPKDEDMRELDAILNLYRGSLYAWKKKP